MSANYASRKKVTEISEDNSEIIPNPNEIINNNENLNNSKLDNNNEQILPSKEINIKIEKIDKKKNNINNNKIQNNQNKTSKKEETKNELNNYSKKIINKNESLQNKESIYKDQISSLEQKLIDIQENHKNNILKLKNDGKSKDINLNFLSKENNALQNNLETISLKLDEMIYKSASNPRKLIKKNILDDNKKKESNYEQQILIKDKEIKREQLPDLMKEISKAVGKPEPSQHEIDKYMSEAKDAVIDKEKFLKNAKERMEKIANM